MLQEWLISDDELEDSIVENDRIEDNMVKDKVDLREDNKELKEEIKAKEKRNKDLKDKLEKMELRATEESIKRVSAEKELSFANRTIDGLLKALENDKSSKRKEKRKEKKKDFVEALVMEKESGETMAGGEVNKVRMQKEKTKTNIHKRQDKMKQGKSRMTVATTKRPLQQRVPKILPMQQQQKKLNMKITPEQTRSHMLQLREGGQAHLSARE